MTEGPSRQADEMFCRSCGSAIKRDVRYCPKCGAGVATAPEAEHIMATQPDMLQDETARRTGQGWVLVLRDGAEAQMRKPKRFSILWFLAWTILSVGTLFWVYLIWHWAKSDQLIFLRVVEGQLVVTGGGRGVFGAWWRWAGERPSTQGKVLAYGGPVAAIVIVIIIISVAASAGGGDGDGQRVAGQPTDPSTQGLPEFTAAECAYLESVRGQSEDLSDAFRQIGELAGNPRLFSDDWILNMAVQLAIIQVLYNEASALNPPPSLQPVQEAYFEGLSKANDATFLVAEGIDHLDTQPFLEATGLMEDVTVDIGRATRLILEFQTTRSGSC